MAIQKRIKIKNNPPLRPIVSQVGTVTYDVAKRLNALIAPFMQKRHMIESTQEFIEIVKTVKQPKLLCSIIRRRELIHKRTNKRHFEHHNRRRVQSP